MKALIVLALLIALAVMIPPLWIIYALILIYLF